MFWNKRHLHIWRCIKAEHYDELSGLQYWEYEYAPPKTSVTYLCQDESCGSVVQRVYEGTLEMEDFNKNLQHYD